MIALVLWLVGFPTIFYHCFLTLAFLLLIIYYKVFLCRCKSTATTATTTPTAIAQQSFRSATTAAAAAEAAMMKRVAILAAMRNERFRRSSCAPHMALALIVLACSCLSGAKCLEQDAFLMRPLASFSKSIINTVTLGVPLEVDFGASDLVKSLVSFTWRTGFPVTMPSGFFNKTQDFYNRIRTRVDNTEVKNVERKSLAQLKLDLDDLVDGIVDQVRRSPDGLYTNYLNTTVRGVPLEDACVAVGIQLKAYGVDLTNYRNIAGAVLGVPLMPQVASTVVDVVSLTPSLERVGNTTTRLVRNPLGTMTQISGEIGGRAFNSLDNLRQNMPLMSLFGNMNQQFAEQMQPVAAAA